MNKKEMMEYSKRMADDEKVFAIIYSMDDVAEWFRENGNKKLPSDKDINIALNNWESNMDLSCTTCLATDFDDLCETLIKNEKKRTKR